MKKKRQNKFFNVIALAVMLIALAVLLILRGKALSPASDPSLPTGNDTSYNTSSEQDQENPQSEESMNNPKSTHDSNSVMNTDNEEDPVIVDDVTNGNNPSAEDNAERSSKDNVYEATPVESSHTGIGAYAPGGNDTPVIQDSDD